MNDHDGEQVGQRSRDDGKQIPFVFDSRLVVSSQMFISSYWSVRLLILKCGVKLSIVARQRCTITTIWDDDAPHVTLPPVKLDLV